MILKKYVDEPVVSVHINTHIADIGFELWFPEGVYVNNYKYGLEFDKYEHVNYKSND